MTRLADTRPPYSRRFEPFTSHHHEQPLRFIAGGCFIIARFARYRVNLDGATYVYGRTSQYKGQYCACVNALDLNNNLVLPLADSFFVRVSAGQISGSLTFRNAQRLTPRTRPLSTAPPILVRWCSSSCTARPARPMPSMPTPKPEPLPSSTPGSTPASWPTLPACTTKNNGYSDESSC